MNTALRMSSPDRRISSCLFIVKPQGVVEERHLPSVNRADFVNKKKKGGMYSVCMKMYTVHCFPSRLYLRFTVNPVCLPLRDIVSRKGE